MTGVRQDGVGSGARFSVAPDPPSRALLRFFDLYLWWFFWRHFHALRVASPERFPKGTQRLIVCLNHPSWWDPLTSIVLSRFWMREANHHAPMDEASFGRYGILRKLGLFPVEQGTARGAAQFLRASQAVLAQQNAVLWLTPQGGFTDVRERPVVLRAGLGALLERVTEPVTVLPLAYEYTFWDERLPEALALPGKPFVIEPGGGRDGQADQVAAALGETQDELRALALQRDPALFTTVLSGRSGMASIYGLWQKIHGEHGESAAAPINTAKQVTYSKSVDHDDSEHSDQRYIASGDAVIEQEKVSNLAKTREERA